MEKRLDGRREGPVQKDHMVKIRRHARTGRFSPLGYCDASDKRKNAIRDIREGGSVD
jgi:hypothetical protein